MNYLVEEVPYKDMVELRIRNIVNVQDSGWH